MSCLTELFFFFVGAAAAVQLFRTAPGLVGNGQTWDIEITILMAIIILSWGGLFIKARMETPE